MSIKTITENLKTMQFGPLYYIFGQEEYLKEHYYSLLKQKCCTDFVEFNVIEFLPKTFDFDDFENCVNSYPVMAERKFIGVHNLENPFVTDKFCEFLKQIPEYCTVVFFDNEFKTSSDKNPLEKAVASANGVVANIEKPTGSALSNWCLRHFKTASKTISSQNLSYLLSIADNDMRFLVNEISKLCSYVTEQEITKEHIDSVVTKSIETNRFAIGDAFCAGDYSKILDIMDKIYKQNTDDTEIARVFYKMFTELYKAKIALKNGVQAQQLATELKISPSFAATKAMKNARMLSYEFLKQAIEISVNLDISLKTVSQNKRELINFYIAELIDRRQTIGKAQD